MKTKVKTKKTLAKKVKITGTGKMMRSHQLRSGHLRQNKSKQSLRRHGEPMEMHKSVLKTMNRLLGRA
ncbi:MAG: 50S ribosomal protein L35 [Candidatus Daviesbacteria bacterium]|nr:50S ribosomal protein L35 [Candidatus Daviesbacteria bacterium]